MKKINESYKLIVFAALALALVLYIGNIWSGLQSLTSVFSPIILGGVLAFIFNVPMKKLEDLLDKCRVPQKLQRSQSAERDNWKGGAAASQVVAAVWLAFL